MFFDFFYSLVLTFQENTLTDKVFQICEKSVKKEKKSMKLVLWLIRTICFLIYKIYKQNKKVRGKTRGHLFCRQFFILFV